MLVVPNLAVCQTCGLSSPQAVRGLSLRMPLVLLEVGPL